MDPLNHPVPGEPLPGVDARHLPTIDMARAAGLSNHYFSEIVGFAQPSRAAQPAAGVGAHDAIAIPILHWCGWFDNYLGQQVRNWKRYRRLDRSCGRNFLMIGPWSHEGPPGPAEQVGILPVSDDGTHRWERLQAFYDRYLMDVPNGFEDEPLVSYFVMGADEWRRADTWPPPGSEMQAWYLHGPGASAAGGGLDTTVPGSEPPDTYAYDPADPSPGRRARTRGRSA